MTDAELFARIQCLMRIAEAKLQEKIAVSSRLVTMEEVKGYRERLALLNRLLETVKKTGL